MFYKIFCIVQYSSEIILTAVRIQNFSLFPQCVLIRYGYRKLANYSHILGSASFSRPLWRSGRALRCCDAESLSSNLQHTMPTNRLMNRLIHQSEFVLEKLHPAAILNCTRSLCLRGKVRCEDGCEGSVPM